MARKCANNRGNCNCSFSYPDSDDFVVGSGTTDSPYVLSDCNQMFRIQDCDASNNLVECGEIITVLPGLNRDDRLDYPDDAGISVDKNALHIAATTSIAEDSLRAFFDEDFVYNIDRLGSVNEPVNCFSIFDLEVKYSAWYTLHMRMEICQEIPAPTVSGGECARMFLAMSNRFGTSTDTVIEEQFETPYWYPPADPNSRGCQAFNWIERVFLPAGFYNEMCLSISYNRRYDEVFPINGTPVGGETNCFLNPSRNLYVNNFMYSITS